MHPALFVRDVVHQYVLSQFIRGGEEHSALVYLGHLVDKLDQRIVVLQHKGIYCYTLLGAALDLFQGLLDRPVSGGIGKVGVASLHVGGGLAI